MIPPSQVVQEADSDRHVPVLLSEVINALDPKEGQWILDGTFGFGGYSSAILQAGACVLGVDRDPEAAGRAAAMQEEFGGRLEFVAGCFGELADLAEGAGHVPLDAVVLDIGVSSMQLDEAERGFSFMHDGPLDMRMSQSGPTAADIVNQHDEFELAKIFRQLGEESQARRIAGAIGSRRAEKPFETTLDLANLIEKTIGRNPKKKTHPATKVFQALRIYVNGELDELVDGLVAAEKCLKPGGRLVVVAFHSLEDRIVKRFFAERSKTHFGGSRHMPEQDLAAPSFTMLVKGGVGPGDEELARNPRARSAKLRAGVRTEAAPHDLDARGLGLPKMLAESRSGGHK
ncbi:16S rRNA (cytosine(1402)-N(4))-methyltransferase RsmH [Cohaesibacter celericrescens]|uniref:Ribosomal RNA small subunit methyltransferase H n=1 Tax=Cohaesibacter celericrescens TaxID=2067669 RepID=A0A2N5XWV1_9HYPH|nr:16S rRNA (cytosine(1402)-N(4))-methyltransferase RsmH [Cohaesibacter celericrescens]PLW75552.1 16S rRNA (cytosine(1402)-N(4))-methyltransferase [Cohaesibacter celericrescens]PLW78959.1 16S rRNA (cytosine(1402)-N(4))-methyltransferase [Cohaesibacter celericrescens]